MMMNSVSVRKTPLLVVVVIGGAPAVDGKIVVVFSIVSLDVSSVVVDVVMGAIVVVMGAVGIVAVVAGTLLCGILFLMEIVPTGLLINV